ncbi:MAG: AAA family ATPase, partial [Blastococcus sp.]
MRSLPAGVQRVLVAGSSGWGKTTMAAALAGVLGLPFTEIDALQHGPGWTPRPEFEPAHGLADRAPLDAGGGDPAAVLQRQRGA